MGLNGNFKSDWTRFKINGGQMSKMKFIIWPIYICHEVGNGLKFPKRYNFIQISFANTSKNAIFCQDEKL